MDPDNRVYVYVPLRDEGTPTVRRTEAVLVGNNTYKIFETPDYDPENENWEFKPGSTVLCFLQHDEGVEIMGDPPVQPLLSPERVEGRHRGEEIELEVGIFRHILQDAPDRELVLVVEGERLAYRIFIPEIFFSQFLGDEQGKRLFQGFGVTHDEGIGEDFLEIRVLCCSMGIKSFLLLHPVNVASSEPVADPQACHSPAY